jgi:hypothetical protein
LNKGHDYPQICNRWRFPDALDWKGLPRQCQVRIYQTVPGQTFPLLYVGTSQLFDEKIPSTLSRYTFDLPSLGGRIFDTTLLYDANNDLTRRGYSIEVVERNRGTSNLFFPWDRDEFWPVVPWQPDPILYTTPGWDPLFRTEGVYAIDWNHYPSKAGWERFPAYNEADADNLSWLSIERVDNPPATR